MFKYLFLLCFINAVHSEELRTKIAILDTGIDYETSRKEYMCEVGNIVFGNEYYLDTNGHGSNIASAIGENIDSKKYCIVSFKFLGQIEKVDVIEGRIRKILAEIKEQNIKFVNYSAQGDWSSNVELESFKEMTRMGIVVSVSAGNHQKNLDFMCDEFPACYAKYVKSDNYHVVGALDAKWYTNYGKIVNYWEEGRWKGMVGTSQANALSLAKYISRQKEK